jgi:protein TonB
MLLERLRREARVRAGERVHDAVRVPAFAAPPAPRRFLQWALAASVAAHVGLGGYALTHLHFDGAFAGADGRTAAVSNPGEQVTAIWLPPPVVNHQTRPGERPTTSPLASAREQAGGRELPGAVGRPGASAVPAVSSAPVGPPVAPGGGAPIVAGYSASGLDGQADRGLPEGVDPSISGPPPADAPRPFTEVLTSRAERAERAEPAGAADTLVDVEPKILHKPPPKYTTKALEFRIEGTVRVSALFAADGTIREIEVVRSLGYGLDEAAIDAVRRMKFTPAMRRGVPVSTRMKVDVGFRVH